MPIIDNLLGLLPGKPVYEGETNFVVMIAVNEATDITGWRATRETFQTFGADSRGHRCHQHGDRYRLEVVFPEIAAAAANAFWLARLDELDRQAREQS